MTTGPTTPRLNASETARGLLAVIEAQAHRTPAPPECAVEIGTTAKRIHTWTITVRGEDVNECYRKAQLVDQALSARFAHEMEEPDNLAAQLAASVVKK